MSYGCEFFDFVPNRLEASLVWGICGSLATNVLSSNLGSASARHEEGCQSPRNLTLDGDQIAGGRRETAVTTTHKIVAICGCNRNREV